MAAAYASRCVALAPSTRCAASQGSRGSAPSLTGAFLGATAAFAAPKTVLCQRQSSQTMALFGSAAPKARGGIYDFTVKGIDGQDIPLASYKGKVLLIVNVASQCGFTPQYTEFVDLYSKYGSKGLEILAFPCNQFGAQEPGSNAEIKRFADRQGAKFALFSKVDVNGAKAEPLWDFLKQEQGGLLTADIKWNFTKFLVDREGRVVKRYASTTTPKEIESDIKNYL